MRGNQTYSKQDAADVSNTNTRGPVLMSSSSLNIYDFNPRKYLGATLANKTKLSSFGIVHFLILIATIILDSTLPINNIPGIKHGGG
jgi:hypothetical protein